MFGPSDDPQIAAKGRELRNLLRLRPDLKEISVYYAGYSGKDNEIDMATRSMLQIMLDFATLVWVPDSDVTQGRAAPGSIDSPSDQLQDKAVMKVMSGEAQPKHAYVSVQCGGRWFWIADTDIQSKSTSGH